MAELCYINRKAKFTAFDQNNHIDPIINWITVAPIIDYLLDFSDFSIHHLF